MDQRKILIVNLSRGLIGEDNAALLGALLVTKMQMAAMSRADIEDIDQRIPFYLYVDEFQNFATDSFTTILSEARKYALILTVANQYIAQMTPGVKDAVFGNVGSIISFRMSADDARTMVKYFEPHFSDYDLIHIHNRHFAVNMTIDGEKVQAFSGTTLNLPDSSTNFSAEIIKNSREQFSYKRVDIEDIMHERYNPEFVRRTLQEINDAPKATSPVSDTPKAEPDKVSHNPTVKVETPKKPLATILRPADAIKRLGFLANNLSEEKEEKPAANKLVDQPTIIKSQPEQPKIQQSEPSEDQALVNPLTSPNKRRRRNRKRPNKEVVMSVPVPTAQPGEVQELGEDNIISLR